MCKLSVAQFAAWELHIYLDTHPNDTEALAAYKKHTAKAKELKQEFETRFGPLTAGHVFGSATWEWIDNPWPWDYCTEVK